MSDTQRLPSGRHQLSREQVASSQRERLFAAVIAVVGERGWSATRIADVVARAGVSRATFYAHFPSLDACLAQGFDASVAQFADYLGRVAAARAEGRMEDRLPAYFEAYVTALQRIDGLPRTLHVEMLRASDEVLEARHRVLDVLARSLEATYARTRDLEPHRPHRSPASFDLLVGGMDELLRERIRSNAGLTGFVEEATQVAREFFGIA